MTKLKLPMMDLGPVFWPKVYCCFDQKDWEAQKNLKSEPWPITEEFLGMCVTFTNGNIIIAISPESTKTVDDAADTIAHESYHSAMRVFEFIGDTTPSEEMTALLVGRISGFVMKEYLKRKPNV